MFLFGNEAHHTAHLLVTLQQRAMAVQEKHDLEKGRGGRERGKGTCGKEGGREGGKERERGREGRREEGREGRARERRGERWVPLSHSYEPNQDTIQLLLRMSTIYSITRNWYEASYFKCIQCLCSSEASML